MLLGAADAALASVGGGLFRHLSRTTTRVSPRPGRRWGRRSSDGPSRRGRTCVRGRGGARPRPHGAASREPDALGGDDAPAVQLTRRETEIAGLVADGLTNREIAERLFMAQRTAEGHVARILRKLGFTTREQIKAWVAEHQRPV